MKNYNTIRNCIAIIVSLAVLEGAVLLAATPRVDGNGALVEQLRSDIDLIYTVSGAVVSAMAVTITVLWFALRSSHKELVETLKDIVKK